MARTGGHGNPNWTQDETILALDLYLQLGGRVPSKAAPEVIALSELLRAMPYHRDASKNANFRNPDGVAFKLMNIRQVATGRGFANVSRTDRIVWGEYGHQPDRVASLANSIRDGMTALEDLNPAEDAAEIEEFREGRVLTLLHYRRERDRKLRGRLLDSRRASGLRCEMCGLERPKLSPDLQEALFETHHIHPLALTGDTRTRVSDLALLCACCHRIIHRMIAAAGRWISVEEAAELLR